MLVKYIGKSFIEDKNIKKDNKNVGIYEVRTSFLKDGLFRFTQPKYLNDQGSEFKLLPYLNAISPTDKKYAIQQIRKRRTNFNHHEITESNILNVLGIPLQGMRYDSAMYPGMNLTGTKSLAKSDNTKFENRISTLNKEIVNRISQELGVFSLSTDPLNEHMWVMYASEGTGIAIEFNEENEFFKQYPAQDVSYKKGDRATYSYNESIELINGIKLKNIANFALEQSDMLNLSERLALSKKESWSLEKEKRIIMRLSEASNAEHNHPLHSVHPKFSFKKIPFSAFKSIILGYNVSSRLKSDIEKLIANNPELHHVKIKEVKHDLYGDLIYI